MSKLNFSNISEAYNIPSAGIKETSEKIEELRKKITSTAFSKEMPEPEYKRIGPPPKVESSFCKDPLNDSDDLELTIFKLMKHPKFDDIIQNYVKFKHPDWILNQNSYESKESFGKLKKSTCDEIKNYVIFFVISISLYLFLSLLLNKQ
jgi:hypothetical protein